MMHLPSCLRSTLAAPLLLSLSCLFAGAFQAYGIEVTETGPHDINGYPTDFPRVLLGQYHNSSAIFLGDITGSGTYWVLSAVHTETTGNFNVYLDGNEYGVLSRTILQNDYGSQNYAGVGLAAGNSDLVLLQLDMASVPLALEDYVPLSIATNTPALGSEMYLLGRGAGDQIWAITENTQGTVSSINFNPYGNIQNTRSFLTTTWSNAPADYGWGASRDSGGGIFHYNNVSGEWELTGIMIAAGTGTGGPPTAHVTIGGLLPFYRDQIYNTAIPEPGTLALVASGIAGLILFRRKAPSRLS